MLKTTLILLVLILLSMGVAANGCPWSKDNDSESGSSIPNISVPNQPHGPTTVFTNMSNSYSTGGSVAKSGEPVQYLIDWGDGSNTGWLPVGVTSSSTTWAASDIYNIRARARCITHTSIVSAWSIETAVFVAENEAE